MPCVHNVTLALKPGSGPRKGEKKNRSIIVLISLNFWTKTKQKKNAIFHSILREDKCRKGKMSKIIKI